MEQPKTLEQLRAERERAETQLLQEQHKLERLENRKKHLEQGVQAAISTEAKKITQPSGAATPRNSDALMRVAVPKALCVLLEYIRPRPKAAKYAVLTPGPGRFVNVQNAPRVVVIPPISEAPVFRRVGRCVRSCWRRRVCTRFHS